MKITVLVENQTHCELKAKHGLSLYIETKMHKILFDLGPDDTLFENAKARGINLSDVDIVIISHGHVDHGGALEHFLQINQSAKVYVQRKAFEPHYSRILFIKWNIGIDDRFMNHSRVVLLDGNYQIDGELSLFTVAQTGKCYSHANVSLYTEAAKDTFVHEQNLIIKEDKTALIMGCGHAGIVNILEEAAVYFPRVCVGGYHLYNPITKKTVSQAELCCISRELKKYPKIQFYTCHCTGMHAFKYLSQQLLNISNLSCGDRIEL